MFVAFWSSVATIVALAALAAPVADEARAKAGAQLAAFTLEQLAAHASQSDCWMAIEGKVYDLTGYLGKHPTPPSVLLPYCGTEATQGMRTKDYGRDHSRFAWDLLANYQVGTLVQ